nr:uncharacterized protein LOC123290021 [Equus asinus]
MCSCIPSLRGSGAQKANNDSLFHRCRHWLRPHLQDLRPFGRRNPQSSTQEMVQELAHGSYGSISLDRGQVQQTTDLARGWTEGRRGESLGQRNEACRMRALQAGLLERLPPSIGPALAPRNVANVTTIMFDCARLSSPPTGSWTTYLLQQSAPPSLGWGLSEFAKAHGKHSGRECGIPSIQLVVGRVLGVAKEGSPGPQRGPRPTQLPGMLLVGVHSRTLYIKHL